MAMVFQDPMQSLNPIQTIGSQIKTLFDNNVFNKKSSYSHSLSKWMSRVQLDEVPNLMNRYPHQLSGGQMQRVMIAVAMLMEPHLVIADEITTGLDAHIKVGIMDMLFDLQKDHGFAVLLISHDLLMVRRYCKRVAVIDSGEILEVGNSSKILSNQKNQINKLIVDNVIAQEKMETPGVNQRKETILSVNGFFKSYELSLIHI